MKIYVGCALKNAPEEYKEYIASFKEKLRSIEGVTILDFINNPNATPKEIYRNDIHGCVADCDLMIADFSHPSLGLGYEVSTMLEKRNMPVIGIAHKDAIVSFLILGIINDNFSYDTYGSVAEMFEIAENKIQKFLK